MLDPSKDKMAYFKDNIQTADDQGEFDASHYYYNRQDGMFPPTVGSIPQGLSSTSSVHSLPGNGHFDDVHPALSLSISQSRLLHSNAFSSQDLHHSRHHLAETNSMLQKPLGSPTTSKTSPVFSATSISSRNSSLDMTEFPALASRVAGLSLNSMMGRHDFGPNSTVQDAGSGLRSSFDNNQFVIQKEDFPALPGFGDDTTDKGMQSFHPGVSTATDRMASSQSELQSIETNSSIGSGAARSGHFSNEGKSGDNHFNYQNQCKFEGVSKTNQEVPSLKEDMQTRYGLLGLLNVIRMTNNDLVMLSLGTDLTALGLDLSSTDCLYSTFASPWAANPSTKEPQYNLPLCYYMQPPALKTSHLSKFQLETLFYIFYAMPKDVLQAYSAQELYNREWQYHMELKLWFKRATNADGLGSPTGSQYIYFDINGWERRLFAGNIHGGLSSGFLREEDVKVKFAVG